MTNQHCYQKCSQTSAAFFYENEDGEFGEKMKCVKSYQPFEGYDYWFFEVESVPAGVKELQLVNANVSSGQSLWLIGHPRGAPKEIDASKECRVYQVSVGTLHNRLENFTHQCDTEGGSSGSPVIDGVNHLIVGLHWGAGASTTDPESGNLAIPIYKVLEHLYANQPDLYNKINKY